jgi:hypothetical protein
VVRVGLIIEALHFTVSTGLVERLGFGERLVGFETQQGNAPLPRELLDPLQDALADAKATARSSACG